ncbi:MAG: hypothetical protein AB7E32_08840 [Desulfovibrio sp.]
MQQNFSALSLTLPLALRDQSHGPTITTIDDFPPLPARDIHVGPSRQMRAVVPAESLCQPAVHVLCVAQALIVMPVFHNAT